MTEPERTIAAALWGRQNSGDATKTARIVLQALDDNGYIVVRLRDLANGIVEAVHSSRTWAARDLNPEPPSYKDGTPTN